MLHLTDDTGKSYSIDDSKQLASGGEGIITPVERHPHLVAKLYHDVKQVISKQRIQELSVLPNKLFVKPLVRLSSSTINGFLMEKLDLSRYYPLDSLFSPSFALKSGLSPSYKIDIVKELIGGVKIAHDNNIVIGDLNPFNIMVDSSSTVKFIDVDSYQTPSHTHNDKLLENIRDYYFGGRVSVDSDYFALAILSFNLFTGIHPYKGFHSVYGNNLKDRMVNNLSILSKAVKDIKIPKFYEPLEDANLTHMYKDIFDANKRFLICVDGTTIQSAKFDGVIVSNSLIISDILRGITTDEVVRVATSTNFLCVTTKEKHYIFNTPNKGIVTNFGVFDRVIVGNILLTDTNVYTISDNLSISIWDKKMGRFNPITNIKIYKDEVYLMKQYENILVIVTKDGRMFTLYLDDVYSTSVKYDVTNVYAESFKRVEGMYQHIGVNNLVYYNNKRMLNQVKLGGTTLKDIVQVGSVGIMTDVDKGKVEYKLFRIDKFNNIKSVTIPERYPFTANDKFIMLFRDDKVSFMDKETLQEVTAFEVSNVQGEHSILTNNAGIILYNNSRVLLLNTK